VKEKRAEALAQQIVDDLFVNGEQKRAARLVLELPGRKDGGGLCELAAFTRVKKILLEN
jgi:hypothetical protein